MRGLMDRMSDSSHGYSLRLEEPDGKYRLWMTFVMEGRCWNVIVAEFARAVGWEERLIDFLAHVCAGVTKMCCPVGVYSVSAPTLQDVVGSDVGGRESNRIPLFNRLWFEKTLRSVFLQIFKGHEPFAVVEFLIVRMKTAVALPWMDRCPVLLKVKF